MKGQRCERCITWVMPGHAGGSARALLVTARTRQQMMWVTRRPSCGGTIETSECLYNSFSNTGKDQRPACNILPHSPIDHCKLSKVLHL